MEPSGSSRELQFPVALNNSDTVYNFKQIHAMYM